MQRNQRTNIEQMNDAASVVSAMINSSTANRRHRRFNNRLESLANQSSNVSNADSDVHLKIDRILYNAYGDIMSIARTAQISWEMKCIDDESCDRALEGIQNDRIDRFLMDFIKEQPDDLIEGILSLDFSNISDKSEARSKDSDQTVHSNLGFSDIVNSQHATEENIDENSKDSSIISTQRITIPSNAVSYVDDTPENSRATPINANAVDEIVPDSSPARKIPTLRSQSVHRSFPLSTTTSNEIPQGFSDLNITFQPNMNDPTFSSFRGSPFASNQSDRPNHLFPDNFEQSFHFNTSIDDNNMDLSHNERVSNSFHFSQERSQRLDDFIMPNDNVFSSKYFSPQNDGEDFSFEDDDLGNSGNSNSEFPLESFTLNSQSQTPRPNIGNIRKMAMESRSQPTSAIAMNSGRFQLIFFKQYFNLDQLYIHRIAII